MGIVNQIHQFTFSSVVTMTNTQLWLVLSIFVSGQDFPISDHGHSNILTCCCFPEFSKLLKNHKNIWKLLFNRFRSFLNTSEDFRRFSENFKKSKNDLKITFEPFPKFSKNFRTLPKNSENFKKSSENYFLNHFRSFPKIFWRFPNTSEDFPKF